MTIKVDLDALNRLSARLQVMSETVSGAGPQSGLGYFTTYVEIPSNADAKAMYLTIMETAKTVDARLRT